MPRASANTTTPLASDMFCCSFPNSYHQPTVTMNFLNLLPPQTPAAITSFFLPQTPRSVLAKDNC